MTRASDPQPAAVPPGQTSSRVGLAVGLIVLGVIVALDIGLDGESAAIVGAYVAPPFITALLADARATVIVGVLATALAVLSPAWNMSTGDNAEYWVRVGLVTGCSVFAAVAAWVRARARGRADRLRLLDAVGDVADGSLPLAETLKRVVAEVVPVAGDICMIDAVHDGHVTRIAVRAHGREDVAEVEEAIRGRSPTLPAWLVSNDPPWRHIPRWVPKMTDEELKRMAQSPEDLRFLRSLDVSSTIVAPITARHRNLGALTLVTAWSGRRYNADDLRFAQILASRIGLALDNAGLFSDLESVERRMDTVMSILDEAVVIHGPDGELLFANPAAARTLGFESAEQAVETPAAQIRERFQIHDESGRELGPDALTGRQASRDESTEPLTIRVVERSTGLERWTRTKSRQIHGSEGEVLYSVTAIEDVTDVKRAEFGQRLLARTGELIAHSDSYQRMLEEVPRLLVPEFADWCLVAMPRADGVIATVASAHRDPDQLERANAVRERFPAHVDDPDGSAEVLRTGVAQLVEFDEEVMRAGAHDPAGGDDADREMAPAIIAPIGAAGRVVGVLIFVNAQGSRTFTADDLGLAAEIGRRCGVAIEGARIGDERERVAEALQRELLPPSLPAIPGWELATMYEPAGELNQVGGDFYEVFPVERGWAVLLGDVSGRGAAAASLTAEARHTIRTAGTMSGDPRAGLKLLDDNLRGRDDAALCSVAIVVLPDDPEVAEVEIYLAGHPHPIRISGAGAEEVGNPGPLLGVVENAQWTPQRLRVARGDQIVIFTDGVIEARGASGERFGSERLRRRLAGCSSSAGSVERVRASLDAFGAEARQDDAAVVAIRRSGYRAPLAEASRPASTTSAAN